MKIQVVNGQLRYLKPTFNDILCKEASLTGYVDAGLPLTYFIVDPVTTFPSRRMVGILDLLQRTQELAIALGHGNDWANYQVLSEQYAPTWWNDRKVGQGQATEHRVRELGYWTWREVMEQAFGQDMDVGISKRAKTRGWRV